MVGVVVEKSARVEDKRREDNARKFISYLIDKLNSKVGEKGEIFLRSQDELVGGPDDDLATSTRYYLSQRKKQAKFLKVERGFAQGLLIF